MVRQRGPRLTLAEKTELWRRWRRGESLNAIGRALGRIAHVVRYEVARTGGIPPAGTAARPPCAHADGAGGHLPRPGARDVAATDQPPAAPGAVDGESGSAAPRGADAGIGLRPLTSGRGRAASARSGVAWRPTPHCVTRWPPSLRRSGRPSRSPAGSVRRILMIRRCACRTKRST